MNRFLCCSSALLLFAPPVAGQSLLNEQFTGTALNSASWTPSMPFSDSGVSVGSGILSVSNGGGIVSAAGYSTPIEVTFAFAFTGGSYDSFRVYTRAGQFNSNGYGAKGVGVSFRIQEDTGNLNGNIALEDNGSVLATSTVTLARNTLYPVRLVDTGSSLSLYWGSSTSPLITASTNSSYGNKIASFNREGAGHGSFISAGSISALDYLTVSALPIPVITGISSPRQVVNLGQSLTLSVTTTTGTAVSYQWKRNGLPISGATTATYTITNASPVRDSGWYQAVVGNSVGSVTSPVVFVNVSVDRAQVLAWGDDSNRQGTVPPGLSGIVAVAAGSAHSLALRADGSVVAWGRTLDGATIVPTGLTNVVGITAAFHSVALKADGTVVAWGLNNFGQSNVPTGLGNVVRVSANYHNLALRSDGTVVAWGRNLEGQSSVPQGLANVVEIAAGGYHSVALKTDGTVVAWGANDFGQRAVPAGLTSVVGIAAANYHSVALKSDGTVVVWGNNNEYGPSTVPVGLSNVIALGATGGGTNHTLGLKADGTAVAWGFSFYGQTRVPLGMTRVVGLAAGGNYSLALRDASGDLAPNITSQPSAQSANLGQNITFTVGAGAGTAPLDFQWRKDGVSIPGATSASYSINQVVSGVGGYYDVVLSNYLGVVTSSAALLSISPAPFIGSQPASLTVLAGQTASFSVATTGSPAPTYQWQKNGVNIPGATSATYAIASPQASDAGTYTCVVTNGAGSVTSTPALLTVLQNAYLANASVRTTLANAQSLIVGFVVSGGAKDVLVRAAGPALVQFGLSTAMTDPRLELYKDSTKILENDNWPGVLASTFTSLGAFPFPANSQDAALLESLNGGYSAVVRGTGPGVVLVETYDAGVGSVARLINISARNRVGTGADILIAGFYIAGTGTKRVLMRAVGPTIGGVPFNVPGTLVDPKLELYDANGVKIAENDNWEGSLAATFLSAGAFALAQGSKDAALIATLTAGSSYTAQVKGADGGAGEALVEIYELP